MKVLRSLKNKGIKFSIVTGRNVSFFDQFPLLVELTDYIISSNGGSIYDVKKSRFIFTKCINDNSLNKLINLGIRNKYTFIINELEKKYKYGELKKIDSYEFDFKKQYNSEQIVFYVQDNYLNEFKDTIKDIEDIIINNVNCKKGRCSIDITDINVCKGNSVLWLCNYLNINSNDVIAFGDGENDVSMFKVVSRGIAVDNACLELKKYADEITDSCYNDGVFKYIENNILK